MINSYLTLLVNPNFRRLWLGQVTSQLALNMLYFVLAIRVYALTSSNLAVSLMILAFGIPAIIFGTLAGGIVDHFDKRIILNFCNFTRVIIFILFFLLGQNIIFLYLLTILISTVTQLFIPAEVPSIPRLVKERELLAANSLFTISFYLSTISGFILAGPTVTLVGEKYVYLVMALLLMLAFLFTFGLTPIKPQAKKNSKILSAGFIASTIIDGFRFITKHIRVRDSLILMTLAQAFIAILSVLAPGFSDRVLSISLTDASILVMAPAAIGLVLGAFWIGVFGVKFLKGSIILAGIIATGIILLFLSFTGQSTQPYVLTRLFGDYLKVNNLMIAILLLFLLGISNSLISIPAATILQQESEKGLQSRIYGVLTSATSGVSILPVLFSGLLADSVGLNMTLFIIGIVILAIGFYQLIKRQRIII